MKRNFFGVLVILIVFVLTLSACSGASAEDMAENTTIAEAAAENPTHQSTGENLGDENRTLNTYLTMQDWDYVVYGELHDIHTLVGNTDIAVGSFWPILHGGEYSKYYGYQTVFINVETLKDIGRESFVDENGVRSWYDKFDTYYYQFTMRNCEDGGGNVELPGFITDIKRISVDDIPVWGGK